MTMATMVVYDPVIVSQVENTPVVAPFPLKIDVMPPINPPFRPPPPPMTSPVPPIYTMS